MRAGWTGPPLRRILAVVTYPRSPAKRLLAPVFALLALLVLSIASCGGGDADAPALGSSCNAPAECDGQCVTSGDFPDGVCTRACGSDDDCPEGFSCISNSGGICLEDCAGAAECEAKRGAAWTCDLESLEEGDGSVRVCVGR